MAYTTKAKVDALNGGTMDSTLFTSLLASVKAFIDRYCGKTFEAASTTKIYDGNGQGEIIVDSFVGSPVVKILETDGTVYETLTEGQANDFVTLPLNSTEKNTIRLTGNGAWGRFSKRKYLISVEASFGASSAVPADIEYAATQLIANIANNGIGDKKSETLGDYSVSYDSIADQAAGMGVMTILDSYRDIDI